jgi:hypothetical protein
MAYAFVASAVLRTVLQGDKVTEQTLWGAVSVYLLIGVIWGLAYGLVWYLDSSAFWFPDQSIDLARVWWPDFLFFSFVTLTTVGYGDIVPVNGAARALAILEAITGTFYIAVLIARLVSTYVASRPPAK